MEKRILGKVWAAIVAGKWRRIVFFFLVLNLVLIAQIITRHIRPLAEDVVEPTPHPTVEEPKEEMTAPPPPTPEATKPPRTNKLLNSQVLRTNPMVKGLLNSHSHWASIHRQKKSPNLFRSEIMGKQQNKVRDEIMKKFEDLDVKELQKAWTMIDSLKNPHSVQQVKIDYVLQALKVRLLEDLSGKTYIEVLDAVKNARPLSDQVRPKPMQLVIATTWRSGSTFLEELLASHPAVYNHYEPLYQFGLHRVREGKDALTAQKLVRDLLSCKYDDQKEYMNMAHRIKEMISRNTLLWKFCKTDDWGDALCFNENFLDQACKLFPWSTMKIVRLRLKLLESVLADESLNAAIVYLVRDPRGVINSRMGTVQWCNTPDCIDPARLCTDMDDDLTAALKFRKQFPGRVFIIRYEDLSLNPANKTRELLDFFNLDFDPKMQTYLNSHTTTNLNKPWSTSRNSKTRVTYWTTKLSASRLKLVQNSCSKVMQRFGYLPVNSTENVTVDKILEPLKLPHD